jgi:hypothetical protein
MGTSSCLTHTPAEAEGVVEMKNDVEAKGCSLKNILMEIIITTHIYHWLQAHIICLLCKQKDFTRISTVACIPVASQQPRNKEPYNSCC